MKRILPPLSVCLAGLLTVGPGTAQEQRPITVDDLLAIRTVSSVDLSPDGKWAAYVVNRNDMDKDKSLSQIWMVSADGKTALPLTGDTYSASDPQWSPDGSQLAFLATRDDLDEDATSQVWTLDMRGGEARAYTDVTQGVDGFEWAPDGQRMVLLIQDESDNDKADREAKKKGETPDEHPYVIDRLQFKEDGVGYLDRTYTHLYLVAGRDEAPQQLAFGQQDDSEPDWSPNGTEIAFVSNHTEEPDSNTNTDIFVVSATPSETPAEPRRITSNPGTEASPDWSPDGTQITYTTVTEPNLIWYATIHLAMAPASGGGEEHVLTKALDRNVFAPKFSADGKSIYFYSEDSGTQPVSAYNLKKGTISPVIGGNLTVWSFDEGPKGKMAAVITRPTLPEEVFLQDGRTLTQITRTNTELLSGLMLSEPQFVSFPDPDGVTVQEFIYPPSAQNPGSPPPAILRIHGGPTAQFSYEFDPFAQLYAANGYATIMVNPRGSSGRGQAYSSAIWADWGTKDFADVMAGVDKAIEMGLANGSRLGVGGWSYGGILTNYTITKTDRFLAAVSGAGEANYTANYGHDIYQREWETELGLPWENQAAWDRIAPFFQAGKVTTPTLFMGGADDWNVPILNGEEFYLALRRRGIETGLVVYPGEDHSIGRPSFMKDRYQRYLGWYDAHIKGG
ncbi:MAG: S9 family peptidase [Hyphomonas sp.]|nr:S9 family peptidase [Hyphomonas sp.]MCB9971383.1 S9 family peptidase [Hyphomonas sp.]